MHGLLLTLGRQPAGDMLPCLFSSTFLGCCRIGFLVFRLIPSERSWVYFWRRECHLRVWQASSGVLSVGVKRRVRMPTIQAAVAGVKDATAQDVQVILAALLVAGYSGEVDASGSFLHLDVRELTGLSLLRHKSIIKAAQGAIMQMHNLHVLLLPSHAKAHSSALVGACQRESQHQAAAKQLGPAGLGLLALQMVLGSSSTGSGGMPLCELGLWISSTTWKPQQWKHRWKCVACFFTHAQDKHTSSAKTPLSSFARECCITILYSRMLHPDVDAHGMQH